MKLQLGAGKNFACGYIKGAFINDVITNGEGGGRFVTV
jgi:hypothetical protein